MDGEASMKWFGFIVVAGLLFIIVAANRPHCSIDKFTGVYESKHGVGREYVAIDINALTYSFVYFSPKGDVFRNHGEISTRRSGANWIIRFQGFIQGYEPRCEYSETWCDGLPTYYSLTNASEVDTLKSNIGDMYAICEDGIEINPWETGIGYVKTDLERLPDA